ncbi:NAD-dependent succinate-semialdehyde dehydrogenase [Legionella jordanis]|uniref:Succinate semialdehyde dehydrogenase n=1 Tax=Legionella jordanis TaxID=456 RepID=A0A0W0VAI6_9GAMM|nr:NAD-dependent succinate-semialdehyde dehydrogenase [Legionella jordanis]KTD17148.1 succinate semialdehyde dehydrogenase [Legionella jordanis]RMX03272.1 NAD-dependent succinate-semialdehyde dehydrogenase [Legionella jordanis]RMX18250.1 NAD-dependent succinate-semialdehyde dehydrogenase [Legionella jordanis]VEH12654.1 succinate semialdehyde dehydrogenase [Legionella jordanis]HAT8713273.1 aldehyde dehydrogenase family protein [Legionella jordanis]
MTTISTINPATEEVIKNYPVLHEEQVASLIEAGHLSFNVWKKTSFAQRKQLMLRLARLLKEQKDELALLITTEMGKPISSAKAEIDKCAWVCEHYAEHAEEYLEPRLVKTEMKKAMVCYQPLGIVFAIMPWNFPFWQVFRFAAPSIMAGNAAILKHAPISTGTGNKIADLFKEAGFPEHLFQHFVLDNDLAAKVIENNKIIAVTLTGSEKAGSIVASNAASHLKKAVLELGGSDPYLVLEDADLDQAATAIVSSRLNNTGQVCIAAKRVIAVEPIHDALIDKIKKLMANYKMGDPLNESTNLGPMAREDLRASLHEQVQKSIKAGAQLVEGGEIPKCKGFYYPATLLLNVKKGMPAFDEELFGPVIAIIKVRDEAEAIQLANDSPYGLAAAVFTQDLERGESIARNDIQAGACFVNAFVASDPRLPFGGIKRSGYGRELSREGILEFVNTKTVAVN